MLLYGKKIPLLRPLQDRRGEEASAKRCCCWVVRQDLSCSNLSNEASALGWARSVAAGNAIHWKAMLWISSETFLYPPASDLGGARGLEITLHRNAVECVSLGRDFIVQRLQEPPCSASCRQTDCWDQDETLYADICTLYGRICISY